LKYHHSNNSQSEKDEYITKSKTLWDKFNQKSVDWNQKLDAYIKKLNDSFDTRSQTLTQQLNSCKVYLEQLKKHDKQINDMISEKVILKIDRLSMHFGGLKAVDDLSFEVKKGEIFGLIGPNGAGKTTVFNCITRFYKPTSGNMYFRNHLNEPISLNNYKVHNVIKEGIVRTFQNVELIWELNVIDNLLVAAHTLYRTGFFGQLFSSRKLKREEIVMTQKAMKILVDLELTNYQYMYPLGLPYGILKKVELARTLMVNPKLIILDEPAAGLNDVETEGLANTIRKIRQEYDATIFLVEHDMGLVMEICDTVCAISFGKKLAIGTPKEIQSSKVVRDAYLGGE
jgi:branched-chain amino acid transport system ATP-binding protein